MSKSLYGFDEVNALKKAEQSGAMAKLKTELSKLLTKKDASFVSYPKNNFTQIAFVLDEVSKQPQEISSIEMKVYRRDGSNYISYPNAFGYTHYFSVENIDWSVIEYIILTVFGEDDKKSPSFGMVIITPNNINEVVYCYRVE